MTDLQEKNDLPKGWVRTKIQNVCELVGGGTPARKVTEYFGGNIPWFTPTEIPKERIVKVVKSRENITELGLQKSSAKFVPEGSVILTSRASIGFVAIAGIPLTTNQGFASFICSDYVYNYFLAYWLWANRSLLIKKATGTTFKEIPKSIIKQLYFNLPPLPEQHKIVTKLESIFAQIDACKSKLDDIASKISSTSLAQLKNSILKQAFEGKLVPQDSEVWSEQKLEDIATIILGQSPPSTTYNKDGRGLPFFQGKADFGERHPTPRNWCDSPKKLAEKNDILISVRAPVGSVNISTETCCIGRGLSVIRPLDMADMHYIFYHLKYLEHEISQKGTGTTFKAITGSQLKSIKVRLPSLNEQHKIVTKLESIFGRIDAVWLFFHIRNLTTIFLISTILIII